jgi:pyridoxal phosphate enzyme (YggS family)
MSEVAENLELVYNHITEACIESQRIRAEVKLIAVSKTVGAELIKDAADAGQKVFGESRLQEAELKINSLPDDLEWHFIGRVQRNKVRKLLPLFNYIHAVDSLRLATYMNEVAQEMKCLPNIFLQVNIGDETTKGGFEPDELRGQIQKLLALSSIKIIGLMCIPPASTDAESARPWFVMLKKLRDELEFKFEIRLPNLSMGMSGDYCVAIAEGATHVRVGSAIFGNRSYRVDGELG